MVGYKYGVLRWSKTGSKYFLLFLWKFFFFFPSTQFHNILLTCSGHGPLGRENNWRYCSWYHICSGDVLSFASGLSINWIYRYRGVSTSLWINFTATRQAVDTQSDGCALCSEIFWPKSKGHLILYGDLIVSNKKLKIERKKEKIVGTRVKKKNKIRQYMSVTWLAPCFLLG